MVTDLAGIVGAEHVLAARGDWLQDASAVTGLRGRAAAVVLPGSAEEACAVVAWCHERGVPVVPRGGGTGYAGGAVPLDERAVVVATDRLDRVRALDAGQWRMEVEAGVTTATVARRARESGLWYPPDPGARESSHIGGNIATNAGGPHCFKHGVTRAWVTGIEAVLAPGELVTVGGPLRKDVAGYDLVGLLCGSEGTLGLITAAWLRLIPAPEQPPVAIRAAFAGVAGGCAAVDRVLACGVVPEALEYLDGPALRFAGRDDGAGMVVLCEAAAGDEPALLEALGDGAEVVDAAVLWRWRDGIGLAVASVRGGKWSEDVVVPVDRLGEAIEATVAIGARHDLEACSWGHAGDGNLHATFLLEPGDEAQAARVEAAVQELLAVVADLGGSVSGEHGLGWLKRGRLGLQWSPRAVAAHRAVKAALDPDGLFNPGKKTA